MAAPLHAADPAGLRRRTRLLGCPIAQLRGNAMRSVIRVTIVLLAAGLAACVTAGYQPPAGPPKPAAVSGTPQPGLLPYYFLGQLDHVDNMPRGADIQRGRRGAPITAVDAESGSGAMWDSQTNRNFSVQMDGLIRFDRPGRYGFAATSNDGIRVAIDGHRVIEDPYVHATQTSPVTWLEVPQAGWYPVTVQYFQKGGTAALKLLWQPPGATGLSPIPAAAFAHR